jgi:hypothetical protein
MLEMFEDPDSRQQVEVDFDTGRVIWDEKCRECGHARRAHAAAAADGADMRGAGACRDGAAAGAGCVCRHFARGGYVYYDEVHPELLPAQCRVTFWGGGGARHAYLIVARPDAADGAAVATVFVRPGRAGAGQGPKVTVHAGGLPAALREATDYLRSRHPGLDVTTKGPHLALR